MPPKNKSSLNAAGMSILSILCLLCFFSCSQPGGGSSHADSKQSDQAGYGHSSQLPGVQFALQKISVSIEQGRSGLKLKNIEFILDSVNLGEQEYEIRPQDSRKRSSTTPIIISGGDRRGLMYGGLELAEQIRLYGKAKYSSGSPFIKQRGIKFNIPLDARTPSYDDSGDAAQENIGTMWEWEFWEAFLDRMAENRYNVLSLWNPHPFPSMIKLEEYPEVALDNVCRTTLKPTGYENEWGDPGLVTTNVMQKLEVIKQISIDEKIAFWQKVMRHARDRGIEIYWINWNICPNSVAPPVKPFYKTYEINMHEYETGKHGITYEISNPITIDYYRKAVRQFLLTYPDVKGIGVTAGEHMPLEWDGYNREKWLWETYGEGILDARKEHPGRQVTFIHRVWHSDMDQIMKYWSPYPDPFQVSFKYAKARLYSSPDLPFADSHIEEMEPYGLKSWWNLRNDDIFVFRWGDPEYVREFLANLPPGEITAGYYMGSDGYVWGREFISKDSEISGSLEIDKHWYRFMLWGRLGYDNSLPAEYFIARLNGEYGLGPDPGPASLLYETLKTASKIIPLVNSFHWRDWDHHWSVESCRARPKLGGHRDVFDFVDNPTLEGSDMLSPGEFVQMEKSSAAADRIPPQEVSDLLELFSDSALEAIENLKDRDAGAEYHALLEDITAQAYLGKYYSSKIRAAIHLARYQESKDPASKQGAIDAMQTAVVNCKEYVRISSANYEPQMLARPGLLDWDALLEQTAEEISLLENY